jgi:hypothetical protein
VKSLSRLETFSRRRMLHGFCKGGMIAVGLPLLDCFLNDNGTALAAGTPLPVRFGTWFWALGMNSQVFIPTTRGADFELPEELGSLADVRHEVNLFTNFNALPDSAPNFCHYTGWIITRTGSAPQAADDLPGETLDVTVARAIARTTRFRMLTAAANGNVHTSLSYESATSTSVVEVSPLSLYRKLFVADSARPDIDAVTASLVRKSVLSGVLDQSRELTQVVGAADRARLDQYFTSLRSLERDLDRQTTQQDLPGSCVPGDAPGEDPGPGTDAGIVAQRHRMLTSLLVMAVACDQTRVFNMAYSAPFATTIKAGYDKPHHTCTHEEPVDRSLGYQPTASWFLRRAMESWADFVASFARVRDGDGTLLDNLLIYATTDTALARAHTLDGIPSFTAGRAGGRIKTGFHIDGAGSTTSRIGYTLMKALGLEISHWGTRSNRTSHELAEILS